MLTRLAPFAWSLLITVAPVVAAAAPPVLDGREGQVLPRDDEEDLEVPPEDEGTDTRPTQQRRAERQGSGDGRDDEPDPEEEGLDIYSGGFELGLRTGFGFPMGQIQELRTGERSPLGDGIHGQIPIWLDLGWRITPRWMVGVYGSYGFILVKEAAEGEPGCPASESCSGANWRFGAQAQFHFLPYASVDPWVGAGLGYELHRLTRSGGARDATSQLRGWEFLNLQAGVDFPSDSGSAFGLFVGYTMGQFTHYSGTYGGQEESGEISRVATHQWLMLGLRGTKVF